MNEHALDELVKEAVMIHAYCDANGVEQLDREAIKLVYSELKVNPEASVENMFSGMGDDSALAAAILGVPREVAINNPTSQARLRLRDDPAYRRQIYDILVTKIYPVLAKGTG